MTAFMITGVHRGIGLELAKQALALGHAVWGSVRHREQGEDLQKRLGERFHPLVFDVTDYLGVQEAAKSVQTPIDVLINNAGVIGPDRQSTLAMDFHGFARTLEINTLAPLAVVQAFLPYLKKGTNPRVITISSMMGSMSHQKSDRIAYRASKAAVNKVMQGLATDLREDGICVISMHPGWVRTDMGGTSADISAQESAAGILRVASGLAISQTGNFINHDGTIIDW